MSDPKLTAAAVRAARLIYADAFGYSIDEKWNPLVPKIWGRYAAIVERETLCGEMAQCLRQALPRLCVLSTYYIPGDVSLQNLIVEAERLLARVEGSK